MKVDNLPQAPGVYIFKDKVGTVLYVGKANNIKKRVKDHLTLRKKDRKETVLLKRATEVEAIQVDSEIEALILEANLIKKFKPSFNSQLKDDKDFLYIKITDEVFPKVLTVRKKELSKSRVYFGPFPSASMARTTLRALRKIFPFSTCRPNQGKACFHYHLGLCPGVCLGKIDERDYKRNIKALRLFLQGKKSEVISLLEKEREKLVAKLRFEEAALVQKKIDALSYITRPVRHFKYLEEDLERAKTEELTELARLVGLRAELNRIECYDVSNIAGKQATGSMVVFTNGQADPGEYRRFRIKTVHHISDTAMLGEVIRRRFSNPWPTPNLIVVDGGKGQLNATLLAVKESEVQVPVIALAKSFELIYLPGKKTPVRLSSRSAALRLLRRIRDEAHRFAISYHRKLREKGLLTKGG